MITAATRWLMMSSSCRRTPRCPWPRSGPWAPVCDDRVCCCWSVAGDLGHRGTGAGLVDDGFAVEEGRDQRLDGEVVDRPWHATGLLVDKCERVVAEERVAAPCEGQVVADVAGGLLQGHAVELVAQGDALGEGGEGAELEAAAQGRLAEQHQRERAGRVHVGVGEQAQFLELVVAEQ